MIQYFDFAPNCDSSLPFDKFSVNSLRINLQEVVTIFISNLVADKAYFPESRDTPYNWTPDDPGSKFEIARN